MSTTIRIATFPLGQQGAAAVVEPYQAGAVYQIDDLNPHLLVGVPNHGAPRRSDKVGGLRPVKEMAPSDDLHWHKWSPLADDDGDIGRQRRYGHYRTHLSHPLHLVLECHVWPGRFCGPGRYQALLADIERELGLPIEWERSDVPVRARVGLRAGPPTDAELLRSIATELRATRILERTGALMEAEGLDADSPESRLVAMWAGRRLADLAGLRRRLEGVVAEHLMSIDGNRERAQRRNSRSVAAQADLAAAAAMTASVGRLAHRRPDIAGFQLSPAMQRDYRLRRLVQAFAPATREQWVAHLADDISTLPPLKAPDVFELWSVARTLASLQSQGWRRQRQRRGKAASEGAAKALESFHVVLVRGAFALTLDYNPAIPRFDSTAAPPMHQRRVPLVEWVHVQGRVDDGLFAVEDLTPDVVLRLETHEGRPVALAIGDATLADARYVADVEGKTKVAKMTTYRERIGWRSHGRLVRCAPGNAFVVYPGPAALWEGIRTLASSDCVLLFPDPNAAHDPAFDRCLSDLVEAMELQDDNGG